LHDLLPVGCSTEPTKPAQTPGRIVEIERVQLAGIVHHYSSMGLRRRGSEWLSRGAPLPDSRYPASL
jgi:hypothetical protein